MARFVDLTQPVTDHMPVYPNDDDTRLYQDKFLAKDTYNSSRLETGMHAGTHIDGPRHFLDRDIFIDDLPIEGFIGNGCLLDARNEAVITLKGTYRERVEENDIVLLYTGFDRQFGKETYFGGHPVVEMALGRFLVERRVKMVGMDLPSPDGPPFEIHKMLLEKGILIIENMANMEELLGLDRFEVMAIPLKIRAEASPARVVARL